MNGQIRRITPRIFGRLFGRLFGVLGLWVAAALLSACSTPVTSGATPENEVLGELWQGPDRQQVAIEAAPPPKPRRARGFQRKGPPRDPRSVAVWLFASEASQAHLMKLGADPTSAMRVWEGFLSAQGIAFARLHNLDQLQRAATTAVLLLPSAVVLSDAEKQAVAAWRDRGGPVFSTWLSGAFSPDGQPLGDTFMREVLGVQVAGNTRAEKDDTYMALHGESPVAHSLPNGTRIWLERVPNQWPLRLVGQHEAAHMMG